MSEREKIEKLIEEYADLFKKTNMDICRSLKGKYFFFRFNKKYNNFECYSEFETAEELLKIIVGELAIDINYLLEKNLKLPKRLHYDLADYIEQPVEYDNNIEKLAQYIDVFAKYSPESYD